MLYELLTGHTPFSGDNYQAVMAQHLQGAIPRLDKENSTISPQLAAVVARSLQRKPEDRYPTMRAFISDLDHLTAVDTSILETGTGVATARGFWVSPTFRTVIVSILILVAIVIFALAAQGLAPK